MISMRQMLDAAQEAASFASGKCRADLDTDRLLNLALVRLVEVVGEAAARIRSEHRDHYPEIPWRQIVGLRNQLIHGYDEVNFDILWQILRSDIPPLIASLKAALNDR